MNENIFDNIGEIYAKYRPTYPYELFEYLNQAAKMNESSIVADIGAGTGILTRELVNRCAQVFAIEPNHSMRKIAEDTLSHFTNFISVNASAENTTLLNNSMDFITVAQAFHWFNRLQFKNECKRILKPQGKVILIWNCRDEQSDIVQAIDSISKKYCPNFSGSACGMRGATNKDDFNDFFCANYETQIFQNDIYFDKERFIGLHLSASYRPDKKEEAYNNYINDLSVFFDTNSQNSQLVLPNRTRVYIGSV